jgi:hypothetical protein
LAQRASRGKGASREEVAAHAGKQPAPLRGEGPARIPVLTSDSDPAGQRLEEGIANQEYRAEENNQTRLVKGKSERKQPP